MSREKISDEHLKKELENGKSYDKIAEEYNLSNKTSVVRKVRNMNEFNKLNKINFYSRGGANIPIQQGVIEEACIKRGLSSDEDLFTVRMSGWTALLKSLRTIECSSKTRKR